MGEVVPHIVTIKIGESEKQVEALPGKNLYEILSNDPETPLESPCGGNGKCGKCKLIIEEGPVTDITDQERSLLTVTELEHGVRLACLTYAEGDVKVQIRENLSAHIMVSGVEYGADVFPELKKTAVQLSTPSLEDQRDDFTRLADALLRRDIRMPLEKLRDLPQLLRSSGYAVTAVHDESEIITVEPGDTTGKNYGIAVDIGTTTVVAYLVDLNTGKTVDTASALNAQRPYGQDVISRIAYTMEDQSGTARLEERIINQISSLIQDLAAKNSIDVENIYSVAFAGNTTMMHLAAGLPARQLAVAPFIPVAKRRMAFQAGEVGLSAVKGARLYLLPGISAYVGADIVADILSSGLFYGEALSLLIDVGTNGEIVLGNRDRLFCCSTAAGPAFEGATIRHGMAGVSGAIDTVKLVNGRIRCTTIAGARPAGICGSGIIDAVAMLLTSETMDETGRMLGGKDTAADGRELSAYLTEFEERPAIRLAESTDSETGEVILLTQKDVREVQLAKASIAAGIMTLLSAAGKGVEDIDIVYLAGGFGSYIDKESAISIGLIPAALRDKIEVIGNAAGTGAVLSLISAKCLSECDRIA
ncbi:MAG: DUF4445 domain-containing protein, partial [Spirochaetales bacterium]|nr:DUF4445 domain-containing protein [Spirochaetales bacterium]